MQLHPRDLKRSLGLIVLLSIFNAGLGLTQPGPNQLGAFHPNMPAMKYGSPRPLDTVVATTRQGEITIGDIQSYQKYRLLQQLAFVPTDKVPALTSDTLRAASEWIATRQTAAAEVEATSDSELTKFVTTNLQAQLDRVIVSHIVRNEIIDKVTSPTQEQIEKFYQDHKPKFKVPFSFTMRHLILLTYEPTTVTKDDTLESIAAAISGDPQQAANVRADLPSRPPRRKEGKTFKPLIAGEKLLVPLSKEKMEEVHRRLETIMKELAKGVSFEELAKKHSEADTKDEKIGPLPRGTNQTTPPLTKLIEVAKATAVGKVSPIFQTKHGFQVIQVLSKIEEHVKSIEEVRSRIVEYIKGKRRDDITDAFLANLFKNPNLNVKYDLIAKGNELTTDTVIATIGNDSFRWNDIKSPWMNAGHPSQPEQIRMKVLEKVPVLQTRLSREWARPLLEDPQSPLASQVKNTRAAYTGNMFLNKLASEQAKALMTEEKTKEYYEKHKNDPQYMARATVKVASMEMRLDPKDAALKDPEGRRALDGLVQSMKKELRRVKSPESFAEVASQINQPLLDQNIQPLSSDKPTALSDLPADVKAQVSALKPGQWSEPFVVDQSRVLAVLLLDSQKEASKPLREVIDSIHKDMVDGMYDSLIKDVEQEYLKKSDFKFRLKS